MQIPDDLKFTKEHEWVRVEGATITVGITEFAQSELGELVFVELPAIGKVFNRGASLCVVESTKAASDVYAPIGGTVKATNGLLADKPSTVNSDPYGEGWLVKLDKFDQHELTQLMSAKQYQAHLGDKL